MTNDIVPESYELNGTVEVGNRYCRGCNSHRCYYILAVSKSKASLMACKLKHTHAHRFVNLIMEIPWILFWLFCCLSAYNILCVYSVPLQFGKGMYQISSCFYF